MKRSAGVLPYKIENGDFLVYLGRPGGPFWEGKDMWSICKGEYTKERALDAALREFSEETGFDVLPDEVFFIGSEKQHATNKLITIFGVKKDFDPMIMKSNTFKKEWPIGSGNIQEFPEMAEGRWFTYDEAMPRIFKGQRRILDKLYDKYKNGYLD